MDWVADVWKWLTTDLLGVTVFGALIAAVATWAVRSARSRAQALLVSGAIFDRLKELNRESRPWSVEIVLDDVQGYLPREYSGSETPFRLRNRSDFDARHVLMVVKLGGSFGRFRGAQTDMTIGTDIAAGEASETTSFPDPKAGKTRIGRVTWLDSRGRHQQHVRIPSLGTYSHRWEKRS
jgi:hypothetical protein